MKLEYDQALLEVTPAANGQLTVKARGGVGGALLTIRVGQATTAC